MKDYNEYLKQEAAYQDLKTKKNPRAKISGIYKDLAANYRSNCMDEFIGDLQNKKILDLGCGTGKATLNALRAGAYVTAIDISPKSIERLLAKAKKEHIDSRLNALVMDAHHLAFEDASFDIIMGNGVLHHLVDLNLALHEIRRTLKTSGYAVFTEPLGMNPVINLYRKCTPDYRTRDEQPLRAKEFLLIKNLFPSSQFVFFDCATLIAKIPLIFGLKQISSFLQKPFICCDNFLLRRKNTEKISLFQKLSWTVVMKLPKT